MRILRLNTTKSSILPGLISLLGMGLTSASLWAFWSPDPLRIEESPAEDSYPNEILPLLNEFCGSCHGPRRQKGEVRFDQLDPDLVNGPDRETWAQALDLIRSGEMPPRRAPKPSEEQKQKLVDWISQSLTAASGEAEGHSAVLRRLNREQYTRTLQDLLGVKLNFGNPLPIDGKSHMGFSNNGEVLRASSLLLEYYQKIAREALGQAIVVGEKPETTHYRVTFGKGIGEGLPGAKTGGYQSVPLDPDHFAVEILDENGLAKEGLDADQQAELDRIKRKITVGLRGSSQDRFHVVDEGVILYSALPHKEVAPGSWQGPSPNIKLEMQRVFPEVGDFVMRVNASRGYLVAGRKELLVSLHEPAPQSSIQWRDGELSDDDKMSLEPTVLGPWYQAGPIFTESGGEARDNEYVAKSGLDFEAPLLDGESKWQALDEDTDGEVQKYETKVGAVILARIIESPCPRSIDVYLGSDDAVFAWLNGEKVHHADVRRGVKADQDLVTLNLQPGRNEFVMKVVNFGGGFGSFHRVIHDGARSSFAPFDAVAEEGAIILTADRAKSLKNLELKDGVVTPNEIPENSRAIIRADIPEGYWQFDLIHPALSADAMGSVRLKVSDLKLDMRPDPNADELAKGHAVTALGAGYLNGGGYKIELGGPFFVGFSHLVMTPLDESHPLVVRLETKAAEEDARLEPALRSYIGTRTDDGMDYSTFDRAKTVKALLGELDVYEFYGRLEDLPIPEPESGDDEILSGICVLGIWNHHLVKTRGETGPPLLIRSLEFEAPFFNQWPPESHTRLFHDSGNREDEDLYTREVLASFLPRAFRRPVQEEEVDRYLEYWRSIRGDFDLYEDGIREVLVAALCSPSFLFLLEPVDQRDEEGRVDEFILANRLSYFLWNSPPDERLMTLAREGKLRASLAHEVDRLLNDKRHQHFVRSFSREWLRMDRLEGMTINPNQFPKFTRFVKEDMAEETYAFMAHLFEHDMSVFTMIDSDFAMLNQNLAEFYGVDGVLGVDFRPVPLDPSLGRGGLLSQGAFHAGHSDGSEPHPIKRAVWVKEKLLGQPPLPPPPNVPDLDPTIPGFDDLTLKERIEQHRDNPSCRDCHASFDPYGIALESYSAVGLLETKRKGRPIDTSTVLPDGSEVEGPRGLKAFLRNEASEMFAESLIEHMFAYALGRDTSFADDGELAAILDQVREKNFTMRSVVHGIVSSPSFRDL